MTKKPSAEEMLHVATTLHAATTSILVCLTKTLENAGTLRIGEFEDLVRLMAERSQREKSPDVAAIMFDFADQLSHSSPTKN